MERVWDPPCGSCANGAAAGPQLVLYNSLVDRKVPFVPAAGPGSKQITWYTCGERCLPPLPPPNRCLCSYACGPLSLVWGGHTGGQRSLNYVQALISASVSNADSFGSKHLDCPAWQPASRRHGRCLESVHPTMRLPCACIPLGGCMLQAPLRISVAPLTAAARSATATASVCWVAQRRRTPPASPGPPSGRRPHRLRLRPRRPRPQLPVL